MAIQGYKMTNGEENGPIIAPAMAMAGRPAMSDRTGKYQGRRAALPVLEARFDALVDGGVQALDKRVG